MYFIHDDACDVVFRRFDGGSVIGALRSDELVDRTLVAGQLVARTRIVNFTGTYYYSTY